MMIPGVEINLETALATSWKYDPAWKDHFLISPMQTETVWNDRLSEKKPTFS